MSPCPNISQSLLDGDTPEKRQFGLFIYIFGILFSTFCFLVFLWGKYVVQFERIQARYSAIVFSMYIGNLIELQADPLEMVIGAPKYYCAVKLVTYLLVIPFIGASIVGAVMSFFFRSRFEQQAIETRNQDHRVSGYGDSQELSRPKVKIMGTMTRGAKELFLQKNAEVALNLGALRFLRSPFASVFLLILLFLTPSVICAAIAAGADPIMASGCTACVTNFTIGSFLVVQASVTAILVFLALWRSRHLPDHWGFLPEVLICICFATLALIGYALSFFITETYTAWNFTFILSFFLWCAIFTQTILQVIIAWRKEGLKGGRRLSKKVANAVDDLDKSFNVSMDKPKLQSILADSDLAKRFEDHLGREFGVESLFFYRDAQRWTREYPDLPVNTRKARAKHIVNAYIRSTGVFAVNLPSSISKQLTDAIEDQRDPPPDFFTHALDEIQDLLERGALPRFIAKENRKNGRGVLTALATEFSF